METGRFTARKPSKTAVISIRLLVVYFSPPEMRFSVPDLGCKSTAAQPPGPGFPEQEPSVNIITSLSVGVILDMGESDFCIIDFLKWLYFGVNEMTLSEVWALSFTTLSIIIAKLVLY